MFDWYEMMLIKNSIRDSKTAFIKLKFCDKETYKICLDKYNSILEKCERFDKEENGMCKAWRELK